MPGKHLDDLVHRLQETTPPGRKRPGPIPMTLKVEPELAYTLAAVGKLFEVSRMRLGVDLLRAALADTLDALPDAPISEVLPRHIAEGIKPHDENLRGLVLGHVANGSYETPSEWAQVEAVRMLQEDYPDVDWLHDEDAIEAIISYAQLEDQGHA